MILAVLLALCIHLPVGAEERGRTTKDAGIGQSIADFESQDLYGNTIDGSVLQEADLTYINFWSPNSAEALSQMPFLMLMDHYYSNTSAADIQVIGVVYLRDGTDPDDACGYLEDNGYSWTNILPDAVLWEAYDMNAGLPQTLIVDRNGIVRDHLYGCYDSYSDMRAYAEIWLNVLHYHFNELCTVTFVIGVTDEVIAEIEIPYGTPILEYPDDPTAAGHYFTGWSYDENAIPAGMDGSIHIAMADTTVTAEFEPCAMTVRFYDFNGLLLSQQTVYYGEPAVAPEPPDHTDIGFVFDGWDAEIGCITESKDIHALYLPINITNTGVFGDASGDGIVSVNDAIIILRMSMNIIPMYYIDLIDYNGDGTITVADAVLAMRAALFR